MACGYSCAAGFHHGRMGAGLTLTMSGMAVEALQLLQAHAPRQAVAHCHSILICLSPGCHIVYRDCRGRGGSEHVLTLLLPAADAVLTGCSWLLLAKD